MSGTAKPSGRLQCCCASPVGCSQPVVSGLGINIGADDVSWPRIRVTNCSTNRKAFHLPRAQSGFPTR